MKRTALTWPTVPGGLRNFTRSLQSLGDDKPRLVWTSRSLQYLLSFDKPGRLAPEAFTSNCSRLARSTWFTRPVSHESLPPSSFPPPSSPLHVATPFRGSCGRDFNPRCHRPTHITRNLKTTHRKPCSAVEVEQVCWVSVTSLPCNEDLPHC